MCLAQNGATMLALVHGVSQLEPPMSWAQSDTRTTASDNSDDQMDKRIAQRVMHDGQRLIAYLLRESKALL